MNYKLKSILLFISCIVISVLGNIFIANQFPSKAVPDDLLFNIVEHSILLEYISDIFVYAGILLFIPVFRKYSDRQKYNLFNQISIFFILRAIFMIFTPLGRPTGVDFPGHGIFRELTVQLGMFPSGHIGLQALIYLLIPSIEFKTLKKFALIILILSAILMVVSLGHYSIDVFGGILLAYFVVHRFRSRE